MNDGATPLFMACHKGHLKVVRLLIESGADKDKATNDGVTPLSVACQDGHLEVARLLIESGADKDQATNNGATPLLLACEKGHLEVARLLLESGATDAGRLQRDYPVQYAAASDDIKLLLALPWDEWNAATPARQEAVRRLGWEYLNVPHRWTFDNHKKFPASFRQQVSAAIMAWQASPDVPLDGDVAVVLAEALHAQWGLR